MRVLRIIGACLALFLSSAAIAGARAITSTSVGGNPAHTGRSGVRSAQAARLQVIG